MSKNSICRSGRTRTRRSKAPGHAIRAASGSGSCLLCRVSHRGTPIALTLRAGSRTILTRELQMKLRDPRLQVAAQVMLLVAFAFWLGGLDAKPARDTHYWIMTVLCAAGIGCSAYLLLREVWGSSS